jgi:DNA-binding CsgD family transcriptional regulator/PAS domain-containing protein
VGLPHANGKMAGNMDSQLIDRIYECSFVPDLWPGVLDELAQMIDAPRGTLLIHNGGAALWKASPAAQEASQRMVDEGWLRRGQFMARLLSLRHSGFVTERDGFTPEELDQEPLWRDFFRPAGFGWGAGTLVSLPSGEHVFLALTRKLERGPVEAELIHRLDTLRSHIARSVLMSARLQLQRASAVSEALALIGLPALVLDERGKVLAANRLIEALTASVHWRARDQVSLKDRAADQLLRSAIATIDVPGNSGVRSFPVREPDTQAMMVAHVIPIRFSARDIFVRCAAVLVLSAIGTPQAPSVELVQSLFDLTPAEARIARSLASGKTVDDIASDSHISHNTIRTHIRGVLAKTGCTRQTDVVALLAGISPARQVDLS